MRVLDYHLPLFVDRAEGARIWDVNGNELIDMNMGYGPLIFGHRSSVVANAIRRELDRRGTILGFPHELSHMVAELIKKSYPSIDLLRFSSTGTEVSQTAIRLARAFTGRKHIVLFEGHYHGSNDLVFHRYHALLKDLEKRPAYETLPGTGGMLEAPVSVYVLPWNDKATVCAFLVQKGESIAAVMMEPVMGNAGVIPPEEDFLNAVRQSTKECGALLIFDEVITGFRIARGGAQERYGVSSDITLLSKAMSGGLPLTVVGGRADIMEMIVKGTVFHGGVYSGNPISLAAALAVQMEYDRNHEFIYRYLESITNHLAVGLRSIFAQVGIPAVVQHVGAMLSLAFVDTDDVREFKSYRDICRYANAARYIRFQHALQEAGVYIHPSRWEPWFISTVHSLDIINTVLERIETTARDFVRQEGLK
jgi:glutamate-1-semialdehyde 2,1-aminomutase